MSGLRFARSSCSPIGWNEAAAAGEALVAVDEAVAEGEALVAVLGSVCADVLGVVLVDACGVVGAAVPHAAMIGSSRTNSTCSARSM